MKTIIDITKTMLLSFIAIFIVNSTSAQSTTDNTDLAKQISSMTLGDSHFMVVGLTTFGLVDQATNNTTAGTKTGSHLNSIADADRFEFSPMFLWRHGDNILVEFEPSWDGNPNGQIGINWADVAYYVAPGFIIKGGYLVLPFGIYTKRLAAGWINKLASDPVGVDMAGTDFGVEIQGGLPLGKMKWSYDIAVSNGFQLNPDGSIGNVGIGSIENGKTVSGRLALLPFSNSCLEVGVSGLMGNLANPNIANPTGDINVYDKPMVTMYAVDFNLVKSISPFLLNVKGQYNVCSVNTQNFYNPDTTSNGINPKYSFNNVTTSYFAQASLRPIQSRNKILKNFELAYRHVYYQTPANSTWGQNYNEDDLSLDYWISWRTVLKLTYENVSFDGTSLNNAAITGPFGTTNISRVILQFSTEF